MSNERVLMAELSTERSTTKLHDMKDFNVPTNRYGDDVEAILISEDALQTRIQELADMVSGKYRDAEDYLMLVCVLKGAVFLSLIHI